MKASDALRSFLFYFNPKPGKETLVMAAGSFDEHYTVQPLHAKGIIDIHKTKVLPGGAKVYETLHQVSCFKMLRTLVRMVRYMKELERTITTPAQAKALFPYLIKNPGWFRRHRMRALSMDPEALGKAGMLLIKKGGRRFRMNPDLPNMDLDQIFQPITTSLQAGRYLLFKPNARGSFVQCGHLSVSKNPRLRFLFMPKRTINTWMKRWARPVMEEFGLR